MPVTIFLLNLALSLGVGVYLWGAWLGNPLLGAADGVMVAGAAFADTRAHRLSHWQQLPSAAAFWVAVALSSGIGAYVGNWFGYQTAGGLAGAALMLIFIFGQDDTNTGPALIPIHGRARWATLMEALEAGVAIEPANGIWLGLMTEGKGRKRQWKLGYGNRERSIILCAVPGAGKFTCSVAPTLLTNTADNILVFDPKGQAAAVTGGSITPGARAWRRRLGKVIVINPFNLLPGKLLPTTPVNPLADIDPDHPEAEAEFKSLAVISCPVKSGDNQPFFAESAQDIIKAAMHHLRITEGTAATLPMVNDRLQQPEIELNGFFRELSESRIVSIRHIGNRYYLKPYQRTKPDGTTELARPTRGKEDNSVIRTVQNALAFLADAPMVTLFSGPQPFSFKELKRPGQRVTGYIVWPASKTDYAKASELLLTSAMNAVLTSSNKQPGVLFIVDEFANALQPKGGGVDTIRKAFSFGRDAGLRVLVVLQTMGQLLTMLKEEKHAGEMIGAAGARIFYGSEDATTDDVIIKMAANETVWGVSRAPETGSPDWQPSSQTAQAKPLIDLHDLREMKRDGGQVMFLSDLPFPLGCIPRFPHYFQIAELAKRADPDPYHE